MVHITGGSGVLRQIIFYGNATTCSGYVQAVFGLVISFAFAAHIAAEEDVRGFPDEDVVIRVMGFL